MKIFKNTMSKILVGTVTTSALLSVHTAIAEPSVEVMHFWTSGGEAAALSAVRQKVIEAGVEWEDAPVAGGGGDNAKTVLQARIAAGNPPTAMLMLGQNIIDWSKEGLLGDVDAVAAANGWDAALPQAVKDFTKIEGHYVSAPTNVHRTDMIWASKLAFDAIGADFPKTWTEFNALAPKFLEAGILPLAHGGQAWQEVYMFEAVALGVGGADFYKSALVELKEESLRSDTMVAVFKQLAELRAMVDENAPGRDWNLATAMVINGQAAMQIMGDWAKGEFTNAGLAAGDDFACIPVPKKVGDGFVYLVNSLSFFDQKDADRKAGQETLAAAIMDPAVQISFNQSKGAIPARKDLDLSALDSCAQATASDLAETDLAGQAVPTFAGTHAAPAAIVGAATDAITEFFNSDVSAEEGAALLAESILLAL
ncbi:MAG: ABC transporter substrate-binding protein [Shimia sp.]|uniref:ABC transporter substrate-binding protein n=1 Tax=Shimia sp. TaxID=1954381 RepID=UPI0025EE9970|nr:ABC transporter substrate-binding protein [Shimia sp.]MCH2069568.1 ABC transporter substrate-binding protein [Shimia sp.]MEC8195034.1 ABC transporter substrate-binding protein [Pseudomonadota bacterium]